MVILTAVESMTTGARFDSSTFSLKNFLGSSLKTSVINQFSNQVTKGIINTFGVTSFVSMRIITVSVGTLFDELFEMAAGLDNHFGFGGDYAGTNKDGVASDREKIGIGQGAWDTIKEIATLGQMNTSTYNGTEFRTVDYDGNYNGWSIDGNLGATYTEAWDFEGRCGLPDYSYDDYTSDYGGDLNWESPSEEAQFEEEYRELDEEILEEIIGITRDSFGGVSYNGHYYGKGSYSKEQAAHDEMVDDALKDYEDSGGDEAHNNNNDDWDGDGDSNNGVNDGSDRMNDDEEEG